MIGGLAAIFGASVIGSLHCAGMCGPFCAVATTVPLTANRRAIPGGATVLSVSGVNALGLSAAYSCGRLVTYLALGIGAGAVGSVVDLGGSSLGLQRAAALLAGGVMLLIGLIGLLQRAGVRLPRVPTSARLMTVARGAHEFASRWGPLTRAGLIGLLTTLLPCGWLYAFLLSAAGTGHPVSGAAVMLAFWAGTVPMMMALGVGLQAALGPVRRHVPLATSLVLVVIAMLTLTGRMAISPRMLGGASASGSSPTATGHAPVCPLCPE